MATINRLREKYLYDLFRVSIFLKGLISLIEIFSGIAILFITPAMIGSLIINISQNELGEEPGSFLALHALPLAQQFSLTPTAFIAIYLLSRGLIKFGLVIALLRSKLWAYPAALAVMGIFIIYQVYQILIGHSIFLIALTLFDFVVIWLIWHEYGLVRRHIDPAVLG